MPNNSTALLIDDPLYFAAELARTLGGFAAKAVRDRRRWSSLRAQYATDHDSEMTTVCETAARLAFAHAVEMAQGAAHWANVAMDLLADESPDRAEAFFASLQEVVN